MVGIGQQREGQAVLRLERSVRGGVVRRDADDDRALGLEVGVRVAEPARLLRSAGGVVLGVEVEDDRPPSEVGEPDSLAGVVLELDLGRRIAFLDHWGNPKLSATSHVGTWADLEAAAPELAAKARALIEQHRFVLLGTIRRDGTPRISPVEARFVEGRLMLSMIPGSLKARDLQRDPRLVVNSPVVHPDDPNVELKLRGRAVEIDDPALKHAAADALEATSGWRPPDGWHFFSVEIEDAAYMAWKEGQLQMERWTRERGLEYVGRSIEL